MALGIRAHTAMETRDLHVGLKTIHGSCEPPTSEHPFVSGWLSDSTYVRMHEQIAEPLLHWDKGWAGIESAGSFRLMKKSAIGNAFRS